MGEGGVDCYNKSLKMDSFIMLYLYIHSELYWNIAGVPVTSQQV